MRKTVGGGPLGSVTGGVGRRRIYARIISRARSMRLIGDAMEALGELSALVGVCEKECLHFGCSGSVHRR